MFGSSDLRGHLMSYDSRLTWGGVVLSVCLLTICWSDASAEDSKVVSKSAPFAVKVQGEYVKCGELNLYKTDGVPAGEARPKEWRLEGCPEIEALFEAPVPSPTVTATPAASPGTCSDGSFSKVADAHYRLANLLLAEGKTYHYCLDVPSPAAGTVYRQIQIVATSLDDAECGAIELTTHAPSGAVVTSGGAQPLLIALFEAGRWVVDIKLYTGCNRYRVDATWAGGAF